MRGFQWGFDLGYQGPRQRKDTSRNLPLTIGTRVTVWNKIMEEVRVSRYTGPFNNPPSKYYMQSPVGLVPKPGTNKSRLIFHLSYDFGEAENQRSFNYHTLDEIYTVQYQDLDAVIGKSLELIKVGHKSLFYAKSDLVAAFRQLPGRPELFPFLMMRATSPRDGKTYYFLDKNIPFGASGSYFLYQAFSDCLAHIVRSTWNGPGKYQTCNYLDDFIFISDSEETCNAMVRHFLHTCQMIGVPVSLEKTEWAQPRIVFFGYVVRWYSTQNHGTRR